MRELLKTGAICGGLAGLLGSALVIGWMFLSPMPQEEAMRLAPIAFCVIETIAISGWMLKNAVIYQVVCLEQYSVEEQLVEPVEEQLIEYEEEEVLQQSPVTLATRIARAAYTQAQWRYEHGTEPTRNAMGEKGMTQPMWNSGRDVLKVMGLVTEGGTWIDIGWEQVNTLFNRITPEENKDRMWVPLANGRGMNRVVISDTLMNNRYTAPPHEPV